MNITIVGGGFGGVKTALELAKEADNRITLISDKADFQYYPALYSTATGRSHLASWMPLEEIFAGKTNVHISIDTITHLDAKTKTLTASSGTVYTYEVCVLALGMVTTYFGIPGLDTYAYGIKSAAEVRRLKQHMHQASAEEASADTHYVVIGAGPTGVELSAMLGSYIAHLAKHYEVKKPHIHIDLIEAAPRILPKMHEATSTKVAQRLQKLGVTVHVGQAVEKQTADEVVVDGRAIKSDTVIWTSGVANHPLYKNHSDVFTLAPNGRVVVDEYMTAAPNIYVIGDNAATPFTGLAQTALHDALFVAHNLKRLKHDKPLRKYKAVMPPAVVPVGETWAVCEWRYFRIYGWIGSLLRQAADLIGYTDMLPLGQALHVWRASHVIDDTPLESKKSSSKTSE